MGRKSVLKKFPIIINGDMSLSSITSSVTTIDLLDDIAIQLNFSGAPIGTFQVQVSSDYAQDTFGNVTNPGNWIPFPLAPAPIASGSAALIMVYLDLVPSSYIRTVYTKTSGSGTLNAFITGKQVG